jgi:hypothetical protein
MPMPRDRVHTDQEAISACVHLFALQDASCRHASSLRLEWTGRPWGLAKVALAGTCDLQRHGGDRAVSRISEVDQRM